MKKRFFALLMALSALFATALPVAKADGTDVRTAYAILYEDGELVFQRGEAPQAGRAFKNAYEVDLTAVYNYANLAPWMDERNSILVASFADAIRPVSTAWWFWKCASLRRVDNIRNLDASGIVNMLYMFGDCSSLTTLDVSGWNTANVRNMGGVFSGCSSLTGLNVSGWNTANVTTMGQMFNGCSSLTGLHVSGWNTANVTNMAGMFCDCSSLMELDVSGWNTANVRNLNDMFSGCTSLATLDVSGWNTANVTDMDYLFNGCTSLTAPDVSAWDTANVTNMCCMFSGCTSMTELDVSGWNTANVSNMAYMFENCSALRRIYASEQFTTVSLSGSVSTFIGCTSLVGGAGTAYSDDNKNATYARIDAPSTPGYFTAKTAPYGVQTLTVDGNRIGVVLTGEPSGAACLIVAAYSDGNQMLRCASQDNASGGTVHLTLDTSGAACVKAFLLDARTRCPLSAAYSQALA